MRHIGKVGPGTRNPGSLSGTWDAGLQYDPEGPGTQNFQVGPGIWDP